MRLTLKTTGLALLLVVQLLVAGCNSGLVILLLLYDDDDDDGGGSGAPTQPALIEFLGIEGARSSPQTAVLRVRVRSEDGAPANLRIQFAELPPTAPPGRPLAPITLRPPLPGAVVAPGTLEGVSTSRQGEEHGIGWNALADFGGDDSYRRVLLRFVAFVDEAEELLDVEVEIGNDAPEIRDAGLSQVPGESVVIDVTLADTAADPVELAVSYSIDGETFAAASLADGPPPPFETSPDGVRHQLAWLAIADVGAVDRPVLVRLVPTDVIPGEPGKTGDAVDLPLELDGNLPPAVEFQGEALIADADRRRGIALRFAVRDRERNPVDVIVQWATGGGGFPDLPAELDTDAAAREALLADPQARAALQIAPLVSDTLDGFVEATSRDLAGAGPAIPAAWLKHAHESRGISPADHLVGRPVRVTSTDGATRERRICGYDGESGLLLVDEELEPPPPPGAAVSIELAATLFMSSSDAGVVHRLIWDGLADLPGGGSVSFRFTPFDRAASPAADGCGLIVRTDDPAVSPGARGAADESGEDKEVLGFFRDDDADTIALAPVDRPGAVTTADLDGDGALDIIYAATGSDALVARLQTSPGRYDELRLLDALLAEPSGIVVLDLDANDLADLAAPAKGSNVLVVMRQHPERDFFTDRSYLSVPAPEGLIAADLDGDGSPDLATVASGTAGGAAGPALAVFFTGLEDCGAAEDGYTSCTFAAPDAVSRLVALAAADADGDGDLDVFCVGGSYLVAYANTGAGFAAPVATLVPGADLTDVAAGDVDGDGDVDIAAIDASGGALIALLGTGDGTFSGAATVLLDGLEGPVELASTSLDANAVSDFVIAEAGDAGAGGIRVAIGSAGGRYSAARLERAAPAGGASPSPRTLTLADLDADGLEDIISGEAIDPATSASELAVYEQAPKGSFRAPPLTIALDAAGGELAQPSFAAADYGGDAYLDLVTVLRDSSEIVIYDQVGPGSFDVLRRPVPPGVAAAAPMAIAAGDIDGDDRVDVVTANFDSGNLTVLLQGESGRLESATEVSSESLAGPQAVALGDVDGDGRLDLVAAGRLSSTVVVFLQQEDGTFDGGTDLSTSLDTGTDFESPIALALGDVDGDGRLEVVSANHRSENLTVFFTFERRPIVVPLGGTDRPVAIALSDLDGDGRADIVTANTTGVAASLARQTSDGSFTVTTLLEAEAGREATAIAAGDLSGDGRRDVVIALAGDVRSALRILIQGDQPDFSDARSLELRAETMDAPVGVLTADLDGDGELDVASINRESGTITWFPGGQ